MNIDERLSKLENEVKELRILLTRYQGFIGGVMFVFSCLGTAIAFFWETIASKLGLR